MQFRTKVACAMTMATLVLGLSTMASADSLKVKTDQGKVQGKTINDGKVRAFLGLPYAAPPVGDLRWKAPEPAAKWGGRATRRSLALTALRGEFLTTWFSRTAGRVKTAFS